MNVTGKTTIYRKDFQDGPAYSRRIASRKYVKGERSDEWVGCYEPVQFASKGGETDLTDRTVIEVKHGFEAAYEKKDGSVGRRLVVMEYEVVEAGKPKAESGWEAVEDIPF